MGIEVRLLGYSIAWVSMLGAKGIEIATKIVGKKKLEAKVYWSASGGIMRSSKMPWKFSEGFVAPPNEAGNS